MLKNVLFASVAAAVLFSCSQNNPNSQVAVQEDSAKIINGTAAQAGEAVLESIVLIGLPESRCTGTLLTDKIVLTAAHCTDLSDEGPIVVTLAAKTSEFCASSLVSAVDYKPNSPINNEVHMPDMVLLKLSTPLCGAKPAVLSTTALKAGDVVRAAGFGIGSQSRKIADRLELKVLDQKKIMTEYDDVLAFSEEAAKQTTEGAKEFSENLKKFVDLLGKEVQTQSQYYTFAVPAVEGQSVCSGDSGGPVYVEKNGSLELVGVTGAFVIHPFKGVEQCEGAYLQMFAPVVPVASWINATLEKWKN